MEDKIIATVNGEPITQQAVDFELQRLIHLYQQQGMPEQQLRLQLDAIRARALEQAIGTKLLIDEAKRLDIPVSGEELDAQFDRYVMQFGGDREKFAKAVEAQGMTLDSFKQELKQGVTINKLIDQICSAVQAPTEDEIKAHYEAHQAEYATEDRVLAQHILIKPNSDSADDKAAAKSKLEAIRARIVSGESTFEMEAKAHSDCPSGKSNGGSLGWFGKGMMVKPFEDVAFAIAENEISEILETQFGYHIIVKTGEEKGHTPELEEIRDKVAEFLFHAKRGQAVADHVAELRSKADVKLA
ncbi:MAG: peptidylprolyl isomerase [Kiritimatiellae bacterium]|nr:peptidylprolyl isomerase [Kiritimatiellia bacterium]